MFLRLLMGGLQRKCVFRIAEPLPSGYASCAYSRLFLCLRLHGRLTFWRRRPSPAVSFPRGCTGPPPDTGFPVAPVGRPLSSVGHVFSGPPRFCPCVSRFVFIVRGCCRWLRCRELSARGRGGQKPGRQASSHTPLGQNSPVVGLARPPLPSPSSPPPPVLLSRGPCCGCWRAPMALMWGKWRMKSAVLVIS